MGQDFGSPFRCDNRKSIPSSWMCDGINDCADNSDERNCKVLCNSQQFTCDNGEKCIPLSYQCDDYQDCYDNSDELYCPTWTGLSRSPTVCTAGGQRCIFPFNYEGQSYSSCTDKGSENGKPWCALEVDSNDNVVSGKWEDCDSTC